MSQCNVNIRGVTNIEVRCIAAIVHEAVVQGLRNQLVAPVGVQARRDNAVQNRDNKERKYITTHLTEIMFL